MVPSPSQNTVAVCNQITLLILCCTNSRLAIQYTNLLYVWSYCWVSSSSILVFRYSFFWFLECSKVSSSSILAFRYSFFWFLECSKYRQYSSSKLDLCCFNSYRPRLCRWRFDFLFNVFSSSIYVLAIIYVLQSFKPVGDHNLILFPNSRSLSFLRLNLSTSNLYVVYLLTLNLSLTFAVTRLSSVSLLVSLKDHTSSILECESSHQERSRCI